MNRRDLLKLFGVGAVVAPVLGDLASPVTAMAKIVEPPKVELIEPKLISMNEQAKMLIDQNKIAKVRVTTEMESGIVYEFEALRGWVCEMRYPPPIDVTSWNDPPGMPRRRVMPRLGPDIKIQFGEVSNMVRLK